MADGNSKKKRNAKTSKGQHGGGGKVRLTRLQLALLGKGPAAKAASDMYRDSLKVTGAKPRKARA